MPIFYLYPKSKIYEVKKKLKNPFEYCFVINIVLKTMGILEI